VRHYDEHEGWKMTPEEARQYATSAEAFDGAICLACQLAEGGAMARYSRLMKDLLGL
jgi:hypothetical protein